MVEAIVGICRGLESFQVFFGGAKWIPSTDVMLASRRSSAAHVRSGSGLPAGYDRPRHILASHYAARL